MSATNTRNTNEARRGAFRLSKLAFAIMGAQLLVPAAQALPQGGQVTSGEARIAQSTDRGTLNITQFTERAVIDWKGFDIEVKETVNFTQAKPDYVILNRVNGGSASSILGKLSADGRVFLINPNGIVFGPNSQVNVAGLIATTANISNKDFMAGQMTFAEPGKATARIVFRGQITAANGGLVALVAPGVENAGVIQANLGKATLASGNVFTLDMFGDGLVSLSIDDKIAEKLTDADGRPVQALIHQSGRLQADGGAVVLLTADAAKGIVDRVINMSGVVAARSLSERPGVIVLHGAGGEVDVSGELDASAADKAVSTNNALVVGGTVKVLGGQVHVTDKALIDASGEGGGLVLIGADRIENIRVDRATHTAVDEDVRTSVDGGEQGNGGVVRVWADDTVTFAGHISARGGDRRGDGGFVELAAGKTLRFDGTVDVSVVFGLAGTLVLIPEPPAPVDTQGSNNGSAPTDTGTTTSTDTSSTTNTSTTPATPAPASAGDVVVTQGGADNIDSGGSHPVDPHDAPIPSPVPAGRPRASDTTIAVRPNDVPRVSTAVSLSVDAALAQPRCDVVAPLDMIRVELASDSELDDGESFFPDYRLIPRPDGLKELHNSYPFLLGLYSHLQLGGNIMALGGMDSFRSGGNTLMFSFNDGMGGGGGGGGAGGEGGAGGAGAGGAGTSGIASAPGRLPQNAQTVEEALAGVIPTDGSVEIASAGDVTHNASGSRDAPLIAADLSNGNKSGADAKEGDTRRLGDARKHIAGRIVGAPCTGDVTQAGHQLAEFTPRTDEAAKTVLTRQAGEGPCTQGGGGARDGARGNQSFVAYGLVSGGRGVAQAADLGRSSQVSGAASDVFRVSYHVINAPRYARGLGLRLNYFCISPFGELSARVRSQSTSLTCRRRGSRRSRSGDVHDGERQPYPLRNAHRISVPAGDERGGIGIGDVGCRCGRGAERADAPHRDRTSHVVHTIAGVRRESAAPHHRVGRQDHTRVAIAGA